MCHEGSKDLYRGRAESFLGQLILLNNIPPSISTICGLLRRFDTQWEAMRISWSPMWLRWCRLCHLLLIGWCECPAWNLDDPYIKSPQRQLKKNFNFKLFFDQFWCSRDQAGC